MSRLLPLRRPSPTLLRGRRRPFLKVVVGSLALVLGLWLLAVGRIIASGAHPQLRSADAIVVLGAAQYNGRPSPVLKARLDYALELYARGLAPLLVVTGGIGVGDTISEGEVALRYALEHGVPAASILVDRAAATSGASIGAAARLLQECDASEVLLVSDPYHMARLELLARRAGLQPIRAPVPRRPASAARSARVRSVLRESLLLPATMLGGG